MMSDVTRLSMIVKIVSEATFEVSVVRNMKDAAELFEKEK